MYTDNRHLVVVAGPTAIGKTALAVNLAKAFQTEVISADSRQIYRDMNIGTAKPTTEEMDGVPHHFVDFLTLTTDYSAGAFERQALLKLDELFEQHEVVVMAGGSGLYVNAVCHGLDFVPQRDDALRAHLVAQFEKEGIEPLQKQLEKLDPEYYEQVDRNNPHRLIRALEVNISSGQSYMSFRQSLRQERPFNIIKIGLNTDRKVLYDRINRRVDLMVEAGLVNEALYLYQHREYNALNTVGYKELFVHFDGDATLDEAIDQIKTSTRRFAKRQLTWFRKDEEIKWFEPGQDEEITAYIREQVASNNA